MLTGVEILLTGDVVGGMSSKFKVDLEDFLVSEVELEESCVVGGTDRVPPST